MVRRIALSSVAIMVAIVAVPASVFGGTRFLVGFAERYTAPDGAEHTHHGVDIAMAPGARVASPLEGTVGFAGRVPGPHGGSILAVTIVDGDRKLTLMPLGDVHVLAGERVREGAAVGTVAGEGDPSSSASHLHAGLRSGSVYVDPSALFADGAPVSPPAASDGGEAPSGGGDGTPVTVETPVRVPTGSGAGAAVAGAGAAALAGTAVSAGGVVARGVGAASGAAVSGSGAMGARQLTVGGELAEGVALVSASGGRSNGLVAPGTPDPGTIGEGETGVWSMARQVGGVLADAAGQPVGAAACLVAALGCAVLFTRRALVRRLASEEPMSHRWGSMLRALRAG